jgi:DNA polymerase-3 subunit delta
LSLKQTLWVEFLGNNLGKINNELEKLQIVLQRKCNYSKDIEENIGFSKDFNVFELRAIGDANNLKLYHCAEFANNKRKPNGCYHEFGFLIFIQLLNTMV